MECHLTAIYGFNIVEARRALWDKLRVLSQGINNPWILGGDFNGLLCPQDRISRNPVQFEDIKDFSKCIPDLFLNELPWKGNYFTWKISNMEWTGHVVGLIELWVTMIG